MISQREDLALSLGRRSSETLPFSLHLKKTQWTDDEAADVTWSPVSTLSSNEGDEKGENHKNKKLRLSKDQSNVLEESFRENHTLNSKEKRALANRLRLQPRQVEVWFQNRRARTKLKQNEVECEYLKSWCQRLAEENWRLRKEVVELRSLKSVSPQLRTATSPSTTMCPSCQHITSSSVITSCTSTTSSMSPSSLLQLLPNNNRNHTYGHFPFATHTNP